MVESASRYPQNIDGISFREVEKVVTKSEFGFKLLDIPRFNPYRPTDVTKSEWIKIIGLDGNDLRHMQMTTRIAQFFNFYNQNPPMGWQGEQNGVNSFSQREQALLVLAAGVHDIGETVVGDISSPKKTEKDHQVEMVVLNSQLQELFGENDIYPAVQDVMSDVLIPRDTKLAKAFSAIERIGYLRVAIRAWERSDDLPDGVLKTNLRELVKSVRDREFASTQNRLSIQELGEIYPAVFEFLNRPRNSKPVGEMLAALL